MTFTVITNALRFRKKTWCYKMHLQRWEWNASLVAQACCSAAAVNGWRKPQGVVQALPRAERQCSRYVVWYPQQYHTNSHVSWITAA